jgi:hypothetical protein
LKEKNFGQVNPGQGQVINAPYSKIDRIVFFASLDKSLWQQLIDREK